MFIENAHAQAAGGGFGGFDFMSLLPLVLIFGVFYLFLIRPQQKKAQQQKDLLSSLRRGDRIITNGGIIGIITKVINDQELQVEIADGVRVRVARAMVSNLLSKTEPASEIADETDASESKKLKTKPTLKSSTQRKKKIS
ncbi:MAG TPA: preprotein translocase subunit YajC [Alphaproteobacteria bacterium]|nr:preprotein translocase subunit YajC [Alphaproteobacteria bacterium]